MYASPLYKDMICGKTMNPICSDQQVGHHLLSKKHSLTQTTDSSLSNSAKGYREWLLSVYDNNWEKYHSIEDLDWICRHGELPQANRRSPEPIKTANGQRHWATLATK